jgi:acyl-CoA reductase-like NAD-dependent aldehyde dehydrogenase
MKMLIGGQKVDAACGKTIDILNPATGEFIDTVPAATKEDIDRALDVAKIGFQKWKKTTLLQREAIFDRYRELLNREDNKRWFIEHLCMEAGIGPVTALFQFQQADTMFRGYIETAKRYEGKLLVPGTELGHDSHTDKDMMMVTYEPIGTVVGVVPFNAPLLLFSFKAAPALAAGNAVIIKPPTDNPLTVIRACELLIEAGVPGEAIQCITARGRDLGTLLMDDPRIDAVCITGSTEVGIETAKCCAKHIIPCELELGGNDPFIVLDDADVDQAASLAAFTRTANAGQVCIAPKRFIVHESLVETFTAKVLENLKGIHCGYPDDVKGDIEKMLAGGQPNPLEMSMMAPVINERAAKKIIDQINHTVEQGATLAYGGTRNGCFVEPTVLTGVTKDMDIAKDMEIFGPVIPIIPVSSEEEAVEVANSSSFGLSGSVFTKDWKRGMKIAREVQSGGMVINGTGLYRNQMQPFGGYKKSGLGREGMVTLGAMMQQKVIIMKNFLQ